MKHPSEMSKTAVMVECAMMVALAFALSTVSEIIPSMPFGGSFTLFSTLPIFAASLRHSAKWGIATALIYSCTQLLMGLSYVGAVPVKTMGYMILCALLDYVVSYTMLGFAGPIARRFRTPLTGLIIGISVAGLLRYAFNVISGIIVWDNIFRSGIGALTFSLTYNGTWFFPDIILVLIAVIPLSFIKPLGLLPQKYVVN